MARHKNAQLFRCQEMFIGLPEALGGLGKKGFGSFMKRQENVHENLFTQNCRKASRMRIKVQVPSVWRADVYLADNYNPFKANKKRHHAVSAWGEAGRRHHSPAFWLAVSWWEVERNLGARNSIRLSWSQVRPGITSIMHPLWTLEGFIWWLISVRWAGGLPHGCAAAFHCTVEDAETPWRPPQWGRRTSKWALIKEISPPMNTTSLNMLQVE